METDSMEAIPLRMLAFSL